MNFDIVKISLKRTPRLILGLFIVAIGISLIKSANLGMNPWGIFNQGLSILTGLTFGKISQIIGLIIIIGSLSIKIYPGYGTIINMLCIGLFIDIIDSFSFFNGDEIYIVKLVMLLVGVILSNYGIYMYISCKLGAGPRDGLMVGVIKLTGKSVKIVKISIELTVVTIGCLLGGKVGIGTILCVFLGGYLLEWIFKMHKYDPKQEKHVNMSEYFTEK